MRPFESRLRFLAAPVAAVAGLAHFLAAPHHLHHAPYVGWLFLAFSAAALVLVFALTLYDVWPIYAGGAALGVAALAAYALFHSLPMPQMQDEVGEWLDPYGIVSVISESILVAACALALWRSPGSRAGRQSPRESIERSAAP